jgi:uncharacterized membrane protein
MASRWTISMLTFLAIYFVVVGAEERKVLGYAFCGRVSTAAWHRPKQAIPLHQTLRVAHDTSGLKSPTNSQHLHKQRSRCTTLKTSTTLTAGIGWLGIAMPITTGPTSLLAAAASTLLISASAGYWSEQKLLSNSGILVTLSVAAVASNVLRIAPTHHPLYDVCWSSVLPASLALLLLSLKTNNSAKDWVSTTYKEKDSSVFAAVTRLAVPFALASIGSVLGCLLSFAICYRYPKAWLSPAAASRAAACLAASFIGGSVNFFATAAILDRSSSFTTSSFVSAMAAADVVVMAFYFAVLPAALQSKRLQQWFADPIETQQSNDIGSGLSFVTKRTDDDPCALETNTLVNRRKLPATLLVWMLAFGLVEAAKRFESFLSAVVPGTACAFLAATIPALTRLVPSNLQLWNDMQYCAEPLSGFAFLFLFAAIGVSADIKAALCSGPACLLFSLTALAVHGLVTLGGSVLFQRVMRTNRRHKSNGRVSLADVLVASNAAIGGPATAAAFCGQVKQGNEMKRSLTLAATIWGIVGYAIGTTVGVALFRFLQYRFL